MSTFKKIYKEEILIKWDLFKIKINSNIYKMGFMIMKVKLFTIKLNNKNKKI